MPKNHKSYLINHKSLIRRIKLKSWVGIGILAVLLPIAFFAAFRPKSAEAVWFDDSWSYRKKLTIDPTKVSGASDLSNFPILVSLSSDSSLSSYAQSDGDDIVFTDINGAKLSHEVEKYASGTLTAWVKIPTLRTTENTVIYLYYGNTTTPNQEDPDSVWDDNYVMVHHLEENCSTATCYLDSTKYANGSNAVTLDGTADSNATGIAGIGITMDGTNDAVSVADNSTLDFGTGSFTVEIWGKSTADSQDYMITKQSATLSAGWATNIQSSGNSNAYRFAMDNDETSFPSDSASSTTGSNNDGAWHYVVGTKNSTTNIKIYRDGTNEATDSTINAGSLDSTTDLLIGNRTNALTTGFAGTLDEARVSNIERSSDWIATSFETIKNPSTFFATGSEEKGSAPTAFWKFDEGTNNICSGGSNDACDSMGNTTFDGALTGATWKTEDMCNSGMCLYFDGTNDDITVSETDGLDIADSQDFTISLWVKLQDVTADRTILANKSSQAASTAGYILFYNQTSGIIDFRVADGTDQFIVSSTSFTRTNEWVQITAVYDDDSATNSTIYINGKDSKASTTGVIGNVNSLDNAIALTIGTQGNGNADYQGFIDSVKIYKYARTAAQVKAGVLGVSTSEGVSASMGRSQTTLSNGLVGYWKLDESSGAASDSSGNSQTLTDASTTTFAGGKFGNGADLELGSTDYQYIADNATLSITGSVTLSAWIKPESASAGTYNILSKWDGADESYRLMQNADEIRMEIDTNGNYVETSSSNLAAGTWYHVTGVYNSTLATAKVYINGREATSTTTGTIPSSIGDDASRFHIGAEDSTGGATGYYDGIVDEARVYKRALSDTEANQLYNFATGPVGYWNYDESTGTTLYDRSGNSNTSTSFNSAPVWTQGKFGGALNFDGVDDYVDTPSSANYQNTNEFSVMTWIKWDVETDAATHYVSYYDTDNNDQGFILGQHFMTYPGLRLFNGTGTTSDTQVQLTAFPSTGVWHHFAAVFRAGTSVKLYLDGVEQATTIDASPGYAVTYGFDVTPSLRIATRADSPTDYAFDGSMDETKVYNYARTGSQIIEDMNGGHPVGGSPISSQYGFYSFDEQQGETTNNKGTGGTTINGLKGGSASAGEADDPTWKTNTVCKIDGCLDFDGGDYVDLGTSFTANSSFSISSWVYLDSNSIANYIRPILAKGTFGADGDGDITLGIQPPGSAQTGTGRWYVLADTTSARGFAISGSAATTGSWVHIAGTWDGTTLRIYENGKLRGSTALSGTLSNGSDSTFIGAYPNSVADTGIDGKIDEVKYYASALTEDQIKIDMNAGSAINFSVGQNEAALLSDGAGNAPVLIWNLDENTSTSAFDTSTNENTGTLTNTPTWTTGKYGYGINLAGSDQHITRADDADLDFAAGGSFALETWFRHDTASAQQIILSKFNEAGYKLIMESDGDITCGIDYDNAWTPTDSVTSTAATYDDNRWHHIACVKSANTSLTLYIDGNSVGTPDTSLTNSTLENTDPIYFGIDADGTSNDYVGQLDHLVIYNYARTQAQVAYDFNRGGPVIWYKFDECSGTTAFDLGTYAIDGTITPGATGNTAAGDCLSGTSTHMWYNGATGKRNASLDFDGLSDYVTASTQTWSSAGGPVTVSFWNYVASADVQNSSAFNFGAEPTSDRFHAHAPFGDNILYWDYGDYSLDGRITTSYTNYLNKWTHVVLVSKGNGGDFKAIYLDGKLVNSDVVSDGPDVTLTGLEIGRWTTPGYHNGKIDDFRIYNYVLSEAQIRTLMNETAVRFGPNEGQP